MNNGHTLPVLAGCDVLPAMEPPRPAAGASSCRQGSKQTAGRFAVLNSFIDFALRSLRRNELAVWLVLYRDTKDGIARTAQRDIARRAGVSDRTVRRAIDRLVTRGLLTVVRRGNISTGPSSYRVGALPRDGP